MCSTYPVRAGEWDGELIMDGCLWALRKETGSLDVHWWVMMKVRTDRTEVMNVPKQGNMYSHMTPFSLCVVMADLKYSHESLHITLYNIHHPHKQAVGRVPAVHLISRSISVSPSYGHMEKKKKKKNISWMFFFLFSFPRRMGGDEMDGKFCKCKNLLKSMVKWRPIHHWSILYTHYTTLHLFHVKEILSII